MNDEININRVKNLNISLEKKNLLSNKRIRDKNSVPLTESEQHKMASELRKMSRMSYLKNRSIQQVDLFRRRLEDEKKLFNGIQLSNEEIKMNQINQKIYDLASSKIKESENIQNRFSMNDSEDDDNFKGEKLAIKDKKIKKLYERYKEKHNEENEEELWEKEQKRKTGIKYGSQNLINKKDKYDLIIENQMNFVKQELLEGIKNKMRKKSHSESSSSSSLSLNSTRKKRKNSSSSSLLSENMNESLKVNDNKKNKTFKEKLEEEKNTLEKSINHLRTLLPIYLYRDKILETIRDNQITIIQGETGCGKTTQLPQYLSEVGYTNNNLKIGITQPRRVAAMSVAARVAYEKNCKLGHEVGYSIRFEENTSNLTKIKFMTDGIFLRELLTEPQLNSYSVIIIDEAHERTIFTDIIFALIKDIIKVRKDLKIIISSATLQTEKFIEYFDNPPLINIPGRRYPVDIYYTKEPEPDYIEASVVTALQIHITQPLNGDILIFLTGQEEIETAREMIYNRTKGLKNKIPTYIILPIYSSLPSEEQNKIFIPTPPNERKIILATNIAETSITIDGVVYVIDCGFSKIMSFNPRHNIETLAITPISKANALQRAGRAGRVKPGKCFRLYTANSYLNECDSENIPEIQRCNLNSVILLLKTLGIDDLVNFDFIDNPPKEILIRGLEQLYALGALNNEGELTKLGREMSEFPIEPNLSKCIMMSVQYFCLDQILTIVSMISVGSSFFYKPRDKNEIGNSEKIKETFSFFEGDHFTLLNIYNQWEETDYSSVWCRQNFIHFKSMKKARNIKEQLINICSKVGINVEDENLSINNENTSMNIRKCIVSGFFFNSAKLCKDGIYRTIKNSHSVYIHPSSSLFKENPRWVIYHQLIYTSKEYMNYLIEIKPEWLMEVAPHYYKNVDLSDDNKKIKNKGTSVIKY